MERSELIFLLTRTGAAGATKALASCDNQANAIAKSQPYRLYGRSDVDRWLNESCSFPTERTVSTRLP